MAGRKKTWNVDQSWALISERLGKARSERLECVGTERSSLASDLIRK